jgi:hypothetical protein
LKSQIKDFVVGVTLLPLILTRVSLKSRAKKQNKKTKRIKIKANYACGAAPCPCFIFI